MTRITGNDIGQTPDALAQPPEHDTFLKFAKNILVGDGCWEWMAPSSGGYGRFKVHWEKGPTLMAHRYAYELLVGPIPAGLQIDHLCRNRACVRPNHLEPVTCKENLRRAPAGRGNPAKPTCDHGHSRTEENLYVIPKTGSRVCRECRRRASKREAQRRKVERHARGLYRRDVAA